MIVYTLEQRWPKWACARLTKNADLRIKSYFQMRLILILAGMQTSKIVPFGAQKTRTYTLKSRRTQKESLFGTEFGSEA